MASIPFTIPGVQPLDLADVEGVARLEGDALVIEFQTVDAFFGLMKSELDEVRLGPQDLASVTYRRGLLHDTLVITARTMRSLESIPGAKGAELKLRCKRRDRKAAQALSSALCLEIANAQLEACGAAQQPDAPDERAVGPKPPARR